MEAIHALHEKITELDREMQQASSRSQQLDERIAGMKEMQRLNKEKQETARKAIERNAKLLHEHEQLLAALQAKNEVSLQTVCVLHESLQQMAAMCSARLDAFQAFSSKTNESVQAMLADLNQHRFYRTEEGLFARLEEVRSRWKENAVASSIFWQDEIETVREKIHKETMKSAVLKEYLQVRGKRPSTVSVDEEGTAAAGDKDEDEEESVIDVTDTHSAVIDLARNTVTPSRVRSAPRSSFLVNEDEEEETTTRGAGDSSPWYHEFKRRRAQPPSVSQRTEERESRRGGKSGFTTGLERMQQFD